jgi:nicotinate-nucleotide pyrophosphorylase (carboxylating)
MKRKKRALHIFDASEELVLDNEWYRAQVEYFVVAQLGFDAPEDVTSQAFPNYEASAVLLAKQDGVLAGVEEVRLLGVEIEWKKNDGDVVKAGDEIAHVTESFHQLMRVERTLLNTLQRMSGIATATRSVVDLAGDTLVAGTRKTLWGALDKKAVAVGGGITHRLGLWDGVMVKDNHIDAVGGVAALAGVELPDVRLKEIEAASPEQAKAIMKAGLPFNVIMLDNFSPEQIVGTLEWARTNNRDYFFEASGGITKENIADYAANDVDVISLGALTHSAQALDISMNIS